jgi:hypothetical protein
MGYMLLIVEPPGQRGERGLVDGKVAYQQMLDFTAELSAAGVLQASNSLLATGSRVQVRGGQTRVVDGPFAEARELVGGFFLLQGVSREQALAWAQRCPAAQFATVEVREEAPCYEGSE